MSNIPCDGALNARPGDEIHFTLDGILIKDLVKSSGLVPTGNGGRVWTYETINNSSVPYSIVEKVVKGEGNNVEEIPPFKISLSPSLQKENIDVEDLFGFATLGFAADRSELATVLKTAVHCLIMGDYKNLEVASFLISQRAKELKELEFASFATTTTTKNP